MALDKEALFNGYPEGAKDKGIKLVSDHGSQPTSRSFMKFCSELGIKQIFATYNNLKGNAETERIIRTIKEEIVWAHEFDSLQEAKERIKIGYKSPSMCFKEWMEEKGAKKLHIRLNKFFQFLVLIFGEQYTYRYFCKKS